MPLKTIVFLSLLVSSQFALAEPLEGDFGRPRLLVPAPKDARFAHLSWPKVATCLDGTLVVACSAGRFHVSGGEGCPAVSISTDGGETFSAPHIVGKFTRGDECDHCGNLALGVAEDGSVVLLAMGYSGDKRATVLGWRSEDSGRTWAPVDTTPLAENRTGSVFGAITAVPRSGRAAAKAMLPHRGGKTSLRSSQPLGVAVQKGLVVFGHYRKPANPSTGIWWSCSKDQGRTWEPPETVTETPYYEPSVTFADGRFIGLLRNAGGKTRRRYDLALSHDMGRTWDLRPSSLAVPEGLAGMQPSPFIVAEPNDPKRLYALQSIRGIYKDTLGRIDLWTADTAALQWRRLGRVTAIPAADKHLSDWSYPWMTPLSDGGWFLVFYAGKKVGENSIYGMQMDGLR